MKRPTENRNEATSDTASANMVTSAEQDLVNAPTSPKGTDTPGPDWDPVTSLGPNERAIIGELVEAMHDVDIDGLPASPRCDTIRGLLWALERLISPRIEPQSQHCIPFNIRLSQDETTLGRAAIDEVWAISCLLLVGLEHLKTQGYISRHGVEVPAGWSPGDFYNAIEDARAALTRLEAFNDKLCQLKYSE
jgi:hypothetical protein